MKTAMLYIYMYDYSVVESLFYCLARLQNVIKDEIGKINRHKET